MPRPLLIATALWSSCLITSLQAAAANVMVKEIEQNDKVRVYESIFNPGDTAPSAKRSMRVVHAIKGGTLERTYSDGTKEKVIWKAGETRILNEEREYSIKNIGKTKVDVVVTAVK